MAVTDRQRLSLLELLSELKNIETCKNMLVQVGFVISPVLPEHSGQYWCVASRGGKTSDYGIMLNVLTQTR